MPVTVTRCLRNIFRCWSARHGAVAWLCSTVTSGSTAATVSLLLRLQRLLARQVEQQFQVRNYNLSSFDNFFNICRLFLRSTTGSACSATSWATATSDSVSPAAVQLPRQQSLQDASFQHFRLRFGNLNGGFYDTGHFFTTGALTTGSIAAATGTSVTMAAHVLLPVRAALQPVHLADDNWIADPDFARGQFRRRARYVNGIGDWVG